MAHGPLPPRHPPLGGRVELGAVAELEGLRGADDEVVATEGSAPVVGTPPWIVVADRAREVPAPVPPAVQPEIIPAATKATAPLTTAIILAPSNKSARTLRPPRASASRGSQRVEGLLKSGHAIQDSL